MNLTRVLLLSFTYILTATANASLCDDLFTYQSGQVMNRVDGNKVKVISEFDLFPEMNVGDIVKSQVLSTLSEYGDYQEGDLDQALRDTDDSSALITIVQSKRTKVLFSIVQVFMGDTEVGNVFSLNSQKKLAELGDGECR